MKSVFIEYDPAVFFGAVAAQTAPRRRLVIVESPYAGQVERNVAYARAAIADCLRRGEAPFASHLLYTQEGVLDDTVPAERQHGIDSGLAWGAVADATVVYIDLGFSKGMLYGIENAARAGRIVENRTLPDWAPPSEVGWTTLSRRLTGNDAVKPGGALGVCREDRSDAGRAGGTAGFDVVA